MRLSTPGIGLAAATLVLAGGATPPQDDPAPAATPYHESCTTCHDRDGESRRTSEVPAASRPDCVRCHAEQVRRDGDGAKRGGHPARRPDGGSSEPAGADRCTVCHDPHRPRAQSMLRVPETTAVPAGHGGTLDDASRLCLDCHPRHADWGQPPGYRRHPVGLAVAAGRHRPADGLALPLRAAKDEDGIGRRVVACTTCHDVHRSKHANLLRWKQEQIVDACTTCHPKDAGRRPRPEVTALRTPDRRTAVAPDSPKDR